MLDADVLADDLVSVFSPNHDYPAFWRTLMRLAHEIAQSGNVVAYFGVTLPAQVLDNHTMLRFFTDLHSLGLVCDENDLRARIARRAGGEAVSARADLHVHINRELRTLAADTPNMTTVDASRSRSEVEQDVHGWIISVMSRSEAAT